MKAENVLALINSAFFNSNEQEEYNIACKWLTEHNGDIPSSTPAAVLAQLAYQAEQEIKEQAVKAKLGSGAATVAKIATSWMKPNGEQWSKAAIGTLNSETYQLFLMNRIAVVALKDRNDLIATDDDPANGENLAKLFRCNVRSVYPFYRITVDPADLECAYKTSRARGFKTNSKTPKQYPAIQINGKGYDAELVRDVLRILGTDNLEWLQCEHNLCGDIIRTDRGMAIVLPIRIKDISEDSLLAPIVVDAEVSEKSETISIY